MLEVTIVGAAGSGKTTLANKIKTMLEADGKSVVISEYDETITGRALERVKCDVLIKTKI